MNLTGYLTVAASGMVLAAVGMYLRKPLAGRWVIPNGLAIGIGGTALGLGWGCAGMHALGYHWTEEAPIALAPTDPAIIQRMSTQIASARNASLDRPLAAGSNAPPLFEVGWCNIGPDGPPDFTNRVVVVDVSAEWCPVCREAASRLFEVHRKYLERGVVFVTLTAENAGTAKEMVAQCKIPWPVGYGAGQTMQALVGTAPTLFVIGPDGRIAWHDGMARYRHSIQGLSVGLEWAIDETFAKFALE